MATKRAAAPAPAAAPSLSILEEFPEEAGDDHDEAVEDLHEDALDARLVPFRARQAKARNKVKDEAVSGVADVDAKRRELYAALAPFFFFGAAAAARQSRYGSIAMTKAVLRATVQATPFYERANMVMFRAHAYAQVLTEHLVNDPFQCFIRRIARFRPGYDVTAAEASAPLAVVTSAFLSALGLRVVGLFVPLEPGPTPDPAGVRVLLVFEWLDDGATLKSPAGSVNDAVLFAAVLRLTPASTPAALAGLDRGDTDKDGAAPPPLCEAIPRPWLLSGLQTPESSGARLHRDLAQVYPATGSALERIEVFKENARFTYENFAFLDPGLVAYVLHL